MLATRQEAGCSPILSQKLGTGWLHPEDFHTEDTSEEEEEDHKEEEENDEKEEENDEEEERERGRRRLNISMICTRMTATSHEWKTCYYWSAVIYT